MTDYATFLQTKRQVLARVAAAKLMKPEPVHVASHCRALARCHMVWLGGKSDEKSRGRAGGGVRTAGNRAYGLGGLQVFGEATPRGEA